MHEKYKFTAASKNCKSQNNIELGQKEVLNQMRNHRTLKYLALTAFGIGSLLMLFSAKQDLERNQKQEKNHQEKILAAMTEFDDLFRRQVQLLIDETPNLWTNPDAQLQLTELLGRPIENAESAKKADHDLQNLRAELIDSAQRNKNNDVEVEAYERSFNVLIELL